MRRLFIAVVLALAACSGSPAAPTNLPPAAPSTKLGPGDLIEVSVVGEKDLPKEFRVSPDGTIDFPYIDRIEIIGLEPQEAVDHIKTKLKNKRILTDPQVSLVVKQYASKKVSIGGQVNKPGSIGWTDGLRLFDVIQQSGGFTSIADTKHVVLTRPTSNGKSVTVVVNVEAIGDGTQPDIPLQAGDQIKVDARVF